MLLAPSPFCYSGFNTQFQNSENLRGLAPFTATIVFYKFWNSISLPNICHIEGSVQPLLTSITFLLQCIWLSLNPFIYDLKKSLHIKSLSISVRYFFVLFFLSFPLHSFIFFLFSLSVSLYLCILFSFIFYILKLQQLLAMQNYLNWTALLSRNKLVVWKQNLTYNYKSKC